ncbi:3-alpha,7-alpha,12-alpha-trihydroxy-5-beta-cholest-24-enoyl-CoA hydratase [Sphingomonas koreensis]|uniref:3-alpha,7-alpha, 12-alpha-trihydroxy-5-beta-cholest-24-enoyl-CoA hydratase n=1 Tax=Sphingomonas koreensis TaxID=93064 RepID=A0A430G025_9SPHN|nr:MaoC/PaaZ C-terminal domain-containing protein [Sphingomonas koreensis]RSY79330.1 3-alpha,7-alpha,12-alpha-trihydroxy-5-beta-cholest-24-enoyl-CoA hydratase [Sphingomonas koreensis]
MTIDPHALLTHDFGERRHAYVERDAILYALGVGMPTDPLDLAQLHFIDETRLAVLPTFAVTLASPGMWLREPRFGIDFARLVHSAQHAEFETPLPAAGEVVGTARVASLTDRGEGRGAELMIERLIRDASSGQIYCRLRQTLVLRGDGGFGGPPAPRASFELPDRAPDLRASLTLSPRAALIYRLSGDWNPLHIDPVVASRAGFDRPIMHGLGSYGAAAAALCTAAGADHLALRAFSCRFSGVVFPGDTIDLSAWRSGSELHFIAAVAGRTVLDQGRAFIEEQA